MSAHNQFDYYYDHYQDIDYRDFLFINLIMGVYVSPYDSQYIITKFIKNKTFGVSYIYIYILYWKYIIFNIFNLHYKKH